MGNANASFKTFRQSSLYKTRFTSAMPIGYHGAYAESKRNQGIYSVPWHIFTARKVPGRSPMSALCRGISTAPRPARLPVAYSGARQVACSILPPLCVSVSVEPIAVRPVLMIGAAVVSSVHRSVCRSLALNDVTVSPNSHAFTMLPRYGRDSSGVLQTAPAPPRPSRHW